MATTPTPRLRSDLHATPAEEQGIKYFDVSDPRSGVRMRMYDFEWLIASRMDGLRPFDEVAEWAKERLGIQPSPGDLEDYARKLRELGFFELESDAPLRAAPSAPTMLGAPAPVIPSGNGAGKSAPEELDSVEVEAGEPDEADEELELEGSRPMPRLVAEAPMLSSARDDAPPRLIPDEPRLPATAAPAFEAPLPRLTRNTSPAATAPTTAMQAVTPPLPPAQEPTLAEVAGTGRVAVPPPPQKSSLPSIIGIVVVLALVGGGVYYVKFMGDAVAKVTTQTAAPREIVRLYDGSATAKKSEGQTLAVGDAGKVASVVAPGSEVKAGTPLVTLEAYAKIEKELADVKDREGYYEKQLANAKAKNEEPAAKAAEAKVEEKRKLLGELESRVGKERVLAPGAVSVAQVLVKQGDDVKSGQPAVKLADRHVLAEFTLGADAAQLKAGQAVTLQSAGGGAPLTGHVAHVDGGKVTIEIADEANVKPGAQVRLVKQRVSNLIPVPATAVVKKNDADVVYVLSDGMVHERKVSVFDRAGTEVLLGSGVSAGDQVVASGGESLHDGQKAAP
jgi:multidrug efflux pump subunit AcrA (membrane-fusion protein)